jgi:Flp pilus assembly protein TadD
MTYTDQNQENRTGESIVIAALAAAVLVVYWQTVGFEFINLDDNLYVYQNQAVLSGINGASVRWACTAFEAATWHPLTWLSLMADIQLFGLNPGASHAVNVLIHLINSVLSFVVFRQLTGSVWKSAAVSMLFTIHPMHVESVAWISERKDVLSMAFALSSMLAYVRFANSKDGSATRYYAAAIILFAFGLMAKPMIVTLPFVFLLIDLWPLRRITSMRTARKACIEKLPFLALSAASCVITIVAARAGGATRSLESLPVSSRVLNAIAAYGKYLYSAILPADLSVWYPYETSIAWWQVAAPAVFLLIWAIAGIRMWAARPYLLIGLLWFVGTLVPVLGLVQVGMQSTADRYTYFPYFGIFLIVVFVADEVIGRARLSTRAVMLIAIIPLGAYGYTAYIQTSKWRDSETLYRHSLSVTKRNFMIEQNLCHALMLKDRLDEAEPLCRASVENRPDYFEALNTLGIVLFKRGDMAGAETNFRSALALNPGYTMVYANLAQAQILQDRPEEGEANLKKAVEMSGNGADPAIFRAALSSLVEAYIRSGNHPKAIDNLKRLIYLQPADPVLRGRLTDELMKAGQFQDAETVVLSILQSDQSDAGAWNTLGKIYVELKRQDDAVKAFRKAIELRPDLLEAKENLKRATTK